MRRWLAVGLLIGWQGTVSAGDTNVAVAVPGGVNVRSFGARGDGVTDDSDAIQAAVKTLPVTAVGPYAKPSASGGTVVLPRGRYKVTRTIVMQRGIRIVGEGRESSQVISFTPASVFRYAEPYKYVPGEIVFENMSIWQDVSVPATSGAGIEVGLGPRKANAVFFRGSNLTIEGTFRGVLLEAGIGSALRDATISRTVSHGVHVKFNPGTESNATQTTSTTFQNVYSYFSQGGDGFRFEGSAYVSCISCASDSNEGYGYAIYNGINTSLLSCGAEQNHAGGIRLVDSQSTLLSVAVVQSGATIAHGITLERARGTSLIGSWISGLNGANGFGLHVVEPAGFVTVMGSWFTGTFGTSPFSRSETVIQIGADATEPLVVPSLRFSGRGGPVLKVGPGNPEGRIVAPVASLFGRTDGSGSGGTMFAKTRGDGAAGWASLLGLAAAANRDSEVIPGNSCSRDTSLPLEGVESSAACSVGLPPESPPNLLASCYVSAPGIVQLRLCNGGREPLALGPYRYFVRVFNP